MMIDDQIKDEKWQYNINREAWKISALSSCKIDKYEYLTGDGILPSNQKQIIGQAKFTYSALGKAFEKQTEKQANVLKSLNISHKINKLKQTEDIFPQNLLNDLIHNKLENIIKLENSNDLSKLDYVDYAFLQLWF